MLLTDWLCVEVPMTPLLGFHFFSRAAHGTQETGLLTRVPIYCKDSRTYRRESWQRASFIHGNGLQRLVPLGVCPLPQPSPALCSPM